MKLSWVIALLAESTFLPLTFSREEKHGATLSCEIRAVMRLEDEK